MHPVMVAGNYVSLTSVWNLLSHKYRDVLMGLNGSKSMLTFFSFPSSVTMVPQYITKPLGGTMKIQTHIKSKTLQMNKIKHLKQINDIQAYMRTLFSTLVHTN